VGEKSILIAIPSVREDDMFFSSIYNLTKELRGKYRVSVLVEKWLDLAEAQNRMAQYFLQNSFDYLLFCDDDVYGHTAAMVEALEKANVPVAAMQAYQRHYPFPNLLMQGDQGIDKDSGYGDIDLTGFQMLLLRREVFQRLNEPYFIAQHDGTVSWATDHVFFKRMKNVNIKMVGCYDHCLNHRGITKENVGQMRRDKAPTYLDRMLAALKTKES
jgi:hypothetical protein